ncbi:MAG TPA: DUF1318 domain-containing protein [Candidatus Hydrogenedentes bacterium]|nr:DUF1318 domain-containing protein [Candidatus Hydrogenedentota bacterium]HOS03352.1 DUF1318 domain-containing protein [Candidatus Hydrogenedentota bacterium]
MRGIVALVAFTASALALGCVITTRHTIDAHITVDIRHIEKQADDVLDFVEGKKDALSEPTAAPPAPSSRLRDILDALAPCRTAYAADLRSASPRITEIAGRMKERHASVEQLKKNSAVGEANNGYLEIRPSQALADPSAKNEAQKVVAAENVDRKDLYREIARLNAAENVSVATVERVYAQKRLLRAASGEIVQLPPAGADFDAFKKSSAGQKLGSACEPGAWVVLP